MKHLFVIDDTGSPGNKSESLTLKSDRKSYLAVLIHSDLREILEKGLQSIILKFKKKGFQIKELHFTDLINRRKEYNTFSSDEVVELFKDIDSVVGNLYLPFFLQTVTPRTLDENGLSFIKYFTKPEDLKIDRIAINNLLIRIENYVVENNLQNEFEITIDSGLKKDGHIEKIKSFEHISNENFMTYKSSEKCILLQIADLFAFSINRHQMLMIKDNRSEYDEIILRILNHILEGNGVSGVKPTLINLKTFTKEDYDTEQLKTIEEKGNLEFWNNANKK